MSGLTRIEADYCEQVPYELRRIANSLEKLVKNGETKLVKSEEAKTEVSVDVPMKDAHPIDSQFDVLAVTNVQVFPFKEGPSMGHIKGLANIVLNDQLNIRGLRIMEGENGLFVGFPNDPFYRGEDLRSVVCPITRQLREHIVNCVLEKYNQVVEG